MHETSLKKKKNQSSWSDCNYQKHFHFCSAEVPLLVTGPPISCTSPLEFHIDTSQMSAAHSWQRCGGTDFFASSWYMKHVFKKLFFTADKKSEGTTG